MQAKYEEWFAKKQHRGTELNFRSVQFLHDALFMFIFDFKL